MKKILLIEDTPALAENIADVLRMADYEVCLAVDGAEGLKVLPSYLPDLVITDLVMPNIDGLQFITIVRADERWRAIPIIILSAKAMREDIDLGYTTGANMYLKKPCDVDLLLESVSVLLKL